MEPVQVYFDAVATEHERSQIYVWRDAHQDPDIEFIAIEANSLSVHGRAADFDAVIGVAPRRGKLAAELDAALAAMRRQLDSH
ncbi:MAG TPA: hypothetical protein VLD86_04080 [Ilumatobacteraceae bacterium]|nr:hypothetical protein [Ilumatobacteraceae bacterium]